MWKLNHTFNLFLKNIEYVLAQVLHVKIWMVVVIIYNLW